MEQIIEQKKASSFITLLLFFMLSIIGVIIGYTITNNNDLVSVIAYTITFLGLLFYFKFKKGLLEDKLYP